MNRVQLVHEPARIDLSLDKAIAQRRSQRRFTGDSMTLTELSTVLHYSAGITDEQYGLRAAPSAGATYPIEIYTAVNNIEGLTRGIYRYVVSSHELELVRESDFRREMSRAALGEEMVMQANVSLCLAAIFQRTWRRYRERALRYIHFEAGHIAQNAYLVATSMGLGACAIGAFYDEDLNRLLGVDGKEESVIYVIAIGKV